MGLSVREIVTLRHVCRFGMPIIVGLWLCVMDRLVVCDCNTEGACDCQYNCVCCVMSM